MQELGVRLPIYPTAPSISEINANGFFNIGDNLDASFPRHGIEINDRVNWAKGKHQIQFGGEMAHSGREDPQRVPSRGTLPVRRQPTAAPAMRSPTSCSASSDSFDQGTGEYKDYDGVLHVVVPAGRLQGVGPPHVEPGRAVRALAAMARGQGRIMHWSVADYNTNVRSPGVPRGAARRDVPRRPGIRR